MGDPRDGDIADAPPAAPAFRQPAGTDALPDPHALAASLQWEVPRRPEAEAIAPQLPEPEPVTPPRPLAVTVATAVAVRQRRAHDRGFATAMLVAVLLVGAYALAPGLAERGLAAAQVTGAREAVDSGRLWLQARAESLTDRAIGGVGGLFD